MYISHFKNNRIQTVKEHNLNVANLTSKYASKINFTNTGFLIGYLHDIGKYNPKFQNYILNVKNLTENHKEKEIEKLSKVDHGRIGGMFLYEKFHDTKDLYQKFLIEICSMCITYHHGGLEDFIKPDTLFETPLITRIKNYDEDYKEAIINFNNENEINIEDILEKSVNEFKNFFNKFGKENLYFLTIFLYSCLIDADRTDTMSFSDNKKYIEKEIDFNVLLNKINNFHKKQIKESKKTKINNLRNKIYNICLNAGNLKNGIYTLTVPTGGGKTISSMAFALKHIITNNLDRVIYNIPYTSIIEQNAQVFRSILGEENVLEYHSNVINDNKEKLFTGLIKDCNIDEINDMYKTLTHRWNNVCITTTFVQFFNTFFSIGTQNIRRFHNLANSVIIFDEVQMMPIKCIGIFSMMCNFLKDICHSTIILCSATQPAFEEIKFKESEFEKFKIKIDGEIIPNPQYYYNEFKRVNVIDKRKSKGYEPDEIANLISEGNKKFNSTLIVCNTKKEAKSIYSSLKISDNIYLLTTNLCPKHRKKIINEMKEKLSKGIKITCVSTQLIQAGVDISFGLVIRIIAGLDEIQQSSGRCNRNGEQEHAETWIINFKNEKLGTLIEIKNGQEIISDLYKLDENIDILSIKSVKNYFKGYYNGTYKKDKEFLYIFKDIKIDNNTICQQIAFDKDFYIKYLKSIKENDLSMPFCFKTINKEFNFIENNTYSVIVPFEDSKNIITQLLSSKTIKEKIKYLEGLQQYTVNLYANNFEKLLSINAIKETEIQGVFVLSEDYYDDKFGVLEEPILKEYIF